MPTIGMPQVKIEFESMGLTAIQRSERGVALLLLNEPKITAGGLGDRTFKFASLADYQMFAEGMDTETNLISDRNDKLIRLAFKASPYFLKIAFYDGGVEPDPAYTLAKVLDRIKYERFNWYAVPGADPTVMQVVTSWHKDLVTKEDKTIKLVAYRETADDETIVNLVNNSFLIKGLGHFNGTEATALIASVLAALPLTRSSTYLVMPDILMIDDVANELEMTHDNMVNAGMFFIYNDGEKLKVARGVNSLTTYHEDKGEDFSKIRIVEAMHLIKDDIRDTWNDFYAGKILNKYENKQQFIALINQVYFKQLEDTVLETQGNSKVDIDLVENRYYAIQRGAEVDTMTEMQIKTYNTGSNVFLSGTVSLLDAMEDLFIKFRNQ